MNRKHLIGTAIVIIIAAILFLLFTNKAEAPEANLPIDTVNGINDTRLAGDPELEDGWSDTNSDTTDLPVEVPNSVTTVTYTDDGFSPEIMQIFQGDTVRFVNQSSGRMWVGSDIHPTHSLYPEKTGADCLGSSFDQCSVSVNGESWEFTFDRVGEWRYHNHVRASKRGTIIVR